MKMAGFIAAPLIGCLVYLLTIALAFFFLQTVTALIVGAREQCLVIVANTKSDFLIAVGGGDGG